MINGVDWCSGRDWVCEGVVRELGTIVKGRINQGTTRDMSLLYVPVQYI